MARGDEVSKFSTQVWLFRHLVNRLNGARRSGGRIKHLNKDLLELEEEGVGRCSRALRPQHPADRRGRPTAAEVVAHRLRSEYDVNANFENASIYTACWVSYLWACFPANGLISFPHHGGFCLCCGSKNISERQCSRAMLTTASSAALSSTGAGAFSTSIAAVSRLTAASAVRIAPGTAVQCPRTW